jgi:hypothetical protein
MQLTVETASKGSNIPHKGRFARYFKTKEAFRDLLDLGWLKRDDKE